MKVDCPAAAEEPHICYNFSVAHIASWRGCPAHTKVKLQSRPDAKVVTASRTNTTTASSGVNYIPAMSWPDCRGPGSGLAI